MRDSIKISWLTAQVDGTEHAVTDDAQVAGMDAGDGIYESLCEARFLVAFMDVGARRRCSFCRARAQLRDWPEWMKKQSSWLSRLGHRGQPADVGIEDGQSRPRRRPSDPLVGEGVRRDRPSPWCRAHHAHARTHQDPTPPQAHGGPDAETVRRSGVPGPARFRATAASLAGAPAPARFFGTTGMA